MIETIAYFIAVGIGAVLGTLLGFNYQLSRQTAVERKREEHRRLRASLSAEEKTRMANRRAQYVKIANMSRKDNI